jgi:hypothetical protein
MSTSGEFGLEVVHSGCAGHAKGGRKNKLAKKKAAKPLNTDCSSSAETAVCGIDEKGTPYIEAVDAAGYRKTMQHRQSR